MIRSAGSPMPSAIGLSRSSSVWSSLGIRLSPGERLAELCGLLRSNFEGNRELDRVRENESVAGRTGDRIDVQMKQRLAWDVVVLENHAPGCSKRLPNGSGYLGDHVEQLGQKIARGSMETRHVRSRKYETVTKVLCSLPGDGQNEDVGGAIGDELTVYVTGTDGTEGA